MHVYCVIRPSLILQQLSQKQTDHYHGCNQHSYSYCGRDGTGLHAMEVAMTTTNSEGEPTHTNVATFDTDTASIGIDNRCSACISHNIQDFDGPVRKVNRQIKGFGGERVMEVYQGTIVWKWLDNEGIRHKFRIPSSYYVPKGKCRLLSPQHWAKTQCGRCPNKEGIGETTYAHKSVLFWDDGKYKLDVYHGPIDNVATFYLAPGYKQFDVFCQQAQVDYDEILQRPIEAKSTLISDDEEEDGDDDVPTGTKTPRTQLWSRLSGLPIGRQQAEKEKEQPTFTPTAADFNLNGPAHTQNAPAIIEEEEDKQPTTTAAQLLRYHQKFGHISFSKLQNMAKQNIIPMHLAHCAVPACSACMFAKATRKQWRSKRRKDWTEQKTAFKPGEIVSVDQLVSPTPGLIGQMTGRLTRKRYKYATVYVDQYSGMGYVYLQKSANAKETIKGKHSFEAHCRQQGVRVQAYHANNGIFQANKWVDDCRQKQQTLTFVGVNAHHSNGLAERRIRSLQDLSRAMLIHMSRRWKMIGAVHLWPYALCMANDAINESPNMKDKNGRSPMQRFAQTEIQIHAKHWIPFGCPAYVLEQPLQSGRGIHNKWEYRSKVGIYLG